MRRLLVTALAFGLFSAPAFASYTFDIENNSDQRIVKVEASEHGKEWLEFDIGSGIPSGDTVTMEWDASTDDSDCEWLFRATFSGGDVLESDWVDFCEDDVVIHFEFD